MRDRNWRRGRRARAIAQARDRARIIGVTPGYVDHWVSRSAGTPHPCSAYCCGNPRAHGQGARACEAWPRADEEW